MLCQINRKSNKMKCSEVHRRLFQYLEEELSEKEQKHIQEHLETCELCYSIYTHTREALYDAKKERIPYQPFFYTRLKQRMEDRKVKFAPGLQRTGRILLQPGIYFAVLGLGIYMGIQLGRGLEPQSTTAAQTEQADYIETYIQSQYLNGMELETIEQEMLTEQQTENIQENE